VKKNQQGLATVEFAIVGALLMLLLLGVIEFARLVFVWNTATEATRRGARIAAVCPVNAPAIQNVTVFNDPATSGASTLFTGMSTADVKVEYLDAGGNPADCTYCNCDDTCGDTSFVSIKYVQVSIENYQHTLVFPPITLTMPPFETTLPRESLGIVPGVGSQCPFG
jgi:Flp pilus assembly protein TadG